MVIWFTVSKALERSLKQTPNKSLIFSPFQTILNKSYDRATFGSSIYRHRGIPRAQFVEKDIVELFLVSKNIDSHLQNSK